jgi:hypothetical protein
MIEKVDTSMFIGNKAMRRKLLNDLARKGRDTSRQNIRTQGGGTWPPLSKWTRAQTGRRKALLQQIPRIHAILANAAARTSAVIFRSPAEWTLTQHHHGFTEPPTHKVVKIELKTRVKDLKVTKRGKTSLSKGNAIYFVDDQPTKVPRRPVWPEGGQLARMVGLSLRKWNREFEAKLRRVR